MKNQNNNFFLNFSQEEQKYLLPLLEEESFEDNQIVFKKNAFWDKMYFIKKGKVKIFDIERLGFEKKQTEIKILEEGDFFGEMSLISEEPRLFSAKTIEKSTLYSINKNNLKQLLDSNSKVEKFIAETFVKRILENNNQ